MTVAAALILLATVTLESQCDLISPHILTEIQRSLDCGLPLPSVSYH